MADDTTGDVMDTVETQALAEFLLAQFAGEGARARALLDSSLMPDELVVRIHLRINVADCEAKRRIVEECLRVRLQDYDESAGALAEAVLRLLALPYAGQPDCRPEWRPCAKHRAPTGDPS